MSRRRTDDFEGFETRWVEMVGGPDDGEVSEQEVYVSTNGQIVPMYHYGTNVRAYTRPSGPGVYGRPVIRVRYLRWPEAKAS